MPKHLFRQMILEKRKALSFSEAWSASILIQAAFLRTAEFINARTIALYHPIHNEVETSAVFAEALAASKRILFPAVSGRKLLFHRVRNKEGLQRGSFGILEPKGSFEIHDPSEADVIVIPGVVFDMRGRRIGYGKGFYDNTLHAFEGQGKFVGFCYDFQVVHEIVDEPHDVKMDLLITDTRVIRPRD